MFLGQLFVECAQVEAVEVALLFLFLPLTGAGAVSKVTTLQHKLWDDSVELGALVSERLALLTDTLLAGAESTEVLDSLRHGAALERKKRKRRKKRMTWHNEPSDHW